MLESACTSLCVLRRAQCVTMLPITMATLSVTNKTDKFDLAVWIQDLNTLGKQDGGRLKQGKTLFVQLQEDGDGNVSYRWAAEQIVDGPAYHGVGVVEPPAQAAVVDDDDAVSPLDISLTGGVQLPFMFRPYP
jgi:hypothetical protein